MKFSTRQLTLMAMCIALNVAIGGIVHLIKLPIFLDAIGTILAVLLIGWIPGVIVGVLSFLFASILINPVYIYFIGTQAVVAIYIFLMAKHLAAFSTWPRTILTGVGLGVVAGVVSAPVIVAVFGGVAGSGRDLITAGLIATGQQVYKAVILSGAASEPVDKVLQCLAVFFALKSMPRNLLSSFSSQLLERNKFV